MAPTTKNDDILRIPLGHAVRSITTHMRTQWITGQRTGATPLLLGPPGFGKTSVLRAAAANVAAELGGSVLIHVVNLNDMEVPDVKGMGLPTDDDISGPQSVLKYTRPAFLPSPMAEAAHDYIFLLVDEIPAATLDQIKPMAQVLLEYMAGDGVRLDPAKYFIAGTGNGTDHRSGAIRLPAHIINRVRLLHCEPDVSLWLDHYAADPRNGIPPLARAFVSTKPDLFAHATVPDAANVPFCTLRSFVQGVRALMVDFAPDPSDIDPLDPAVFDNAFSEDNAPVATALFAGDVGRGVAHEFVMYGKVRHLLTPLEEILDDPENARLPTDHSAIYAQAGYVTAWAGRRTDRSGKPESSKDWFDRAEKLLQYLGRMRSDMLAPAMQQFMDICPSITRSPHFSRLARENQGLLMATGAAA